MSKAKQKRGPKPDHLKVEGNWEDAVKKALEKKRPEGGWPTTEDDPKGETSKREK